MSADSILAAVQALLAVGGGGLGVAAVGKVLLKAMRPPPAPSKSAPSSLPPARLPHISYPDMTEELGRLRGELHDRIEASEEACNEARKELALLQQKQYEILDKKVSDTAEKVHTLIGEFRGSSSVRRRQ